MRKGMLDALLVLCIWSGFVLVSRLGGKSVLLPTDIVALRFGVAALVLLPLWVFRNKLNVLSPRIIALGLTGGIGYCTFAYMGFKYAPAAHGAILLPGLLPFEVAIFSFLMLGEKPTRRRLLGLASIALGVVCLAIDSMHSDAPHWLGDISFIIAGCFWAFYTMLVRHWQVSVWDATIGCAMVSAAIYLPIYLLFIPGNISAAPWDAILLQGFYQGIMAMVVAMVFYMRAVKALGPTQVGLFMALVPCVAGLAAVPLLGEPLTLPVIAGLFFTSLGAWVGSRR